MYGIDSDLRLLWHPRGSINGGKPNLHDSNDHVTKGDTL